MKAAGVEKWLAASLRCAGREEFWDSLETLFQAVELKESLLHGGYPKLNPHQHDKVRMAAIAGTNSMQVHCVIIACPWSAPKANTGVRELARDVPGE